MVGRARRRPEDQAVFDYLDQFWAAPQLLQPRCHGAITTQCVVCLKIESCMRKLSRPVPSCPKCRALVLPGDLQTVWTRFPSQKKLKH